jgi:Domain of unknown function (DUF6468)
MFLDLPIAFVVEVTLIALLVVTLLFCARLERSLRHLRNDQESLSGTVRALNGAIATAQASLAGLRTAARDADETLGRKVVAARGLADELSLLTSAADRIAGRMENAKSAPGEGAVRMAPVFGDAFRIAR